MQEKFIFKRRNRIKKHFVNTSNVLLYCYQNLSDSAKITYQVIDGFDWESKETGDSKGYAFPSVETIARIRHTTDRSIRRHIEELGEGGLLTRVRRRNKPSIFIIEDISEGEEEKYLREYVDNKNNGDSGGNAPPEEIGGDESSYEKSRMDKNVRSQTPEWTKMSVAYKKENKDSFKENEINVNENLPIEKNRVGQLKELLPTYKSSLSRKSMSKNRKDRRMLSEEDLAKRDYIASEIAAKLDDLKSLGAFRVIAEKVPEPVIFEVLSNIKETAREGKIKVSPGALFVNIMQGYCDAHGVDLGFNFKGGMSLETTN